MYTFLIIIKRNLFILLMLNNVSTKMQTHLSMILYHKRKNNFSGRYEGPHTILKKINTVTYLTVIDKVGKKQVEKKRYSTNEKIYKSIANKKYVLL